MKKNKMMRTASGLLALTLLTTGVISGTFAKYTTEDSAYDVARVAKWGVTLQAVGSLYGEKYATGSVGVPTTNGDTASVIGSQIGNGVDANDKAVVAPGTKSSSEGFSFALNGTPEVSSQTSMKIEAANVMLTDGSYGVMVENKNVTDENYASLKESLYASKDKKTFVKAGDTKDADTKYYTLEDEVTTDTYYPVVYALDGTSSVDTATDGVTKNSIETIAATLTGKVSDAANKADNTANPAKVSYTATSKENRPNVKLDGLNNEKITWAWAFEGNENNKAVGNKADVTNKADTILGNLMALKVKAADSTKEFDGIVVKADQSGNTYNEITVENDEVYTKDANQGDSAQGTKIADNYVAKVNGTVVANLSTYFYIDIAVTQVD